MWMIEQFAPKAGLVDDVIDFAIWPLFSSQQITPHSCDYGDDVICCYKSYH